METAKTGASGYQQRGTEDQGSGGALDPRAEAHRRDLEAAIKPGDLMKMYLKAGASPQYLAMRYGVDVQRCERYLAALKAQEEQKRERIQSASGNREIPENGQEPDAA